MSLLFADIYDGIRCIRASKGACEKDILNYVQEKVGGCMTVGNVLKTIRTLKKLVDDGVLEQKGNRYKMSSNYQNNDSNDEPPEDDCQEIPVEEPECDEEEKSEEEEEEDQPECEDEEEEEDDEDDDDEEDEDDDDDEDDDECDEKDGMPQQEDCPPPTEKENTQMEKPKCPLPARVSANEGDSCDPSTEENRDEENFQKNLLTGSGKKSGRSSNKETPCLQQAEDNEKTKEGEAIAFCARDFMDSLGKAKNEEKRQEKPQKSPELKSDRADAKKIPEICKTFQSNKRVFRMKKKRESRCFRSTSRNNMYGLAKGPSDETSFRDGGSDQEPVDGLMEVDLEKNLEDEPGNIKEDFPTLLNPDEELDREGFCSSVRHLKANDDVKMESSSEEFSEKPAHKPSQMKVLQLQKSGCGSLDWYTLEENEKRPELLKRSRLPSFDEDKKFSFCSVCEKKKRSE